MKLVIGLTSCKAHDDRDNLVRSTWLPKASALGISVYFIKGGACQTCVDGDVLWLNVHDDYRALPQKTRAWMEWALKNTDAEWIGKGDNDTLLIPERLVNYDFSNKQYVGREPGVRWRNYASGGAMYFVDRAFAGIIAKEMTVSQGAEDVLTGRLAKTHGVKLFQDQRFIPWGSPERCPRANNDLITCHQIPTPLWMEICKEIYG